MTAAADSVTTAADSVTTDTGVPVIRASGGPFTIGLRHGQARAAALRAFIDDSLCRLNLLLDTPVSMPGLAPVIDAYGAAIASATPDLAAETRGLAEGAGISLRHAWLLQLRREIMGYRRVPTMGDCTAYARAGSAGPSGPVLAQTVDLSGNLDDQIAVLEVAPVRSSRRSLVLSFGGLLGYLGMNSDGLAVGLNLVLGGQWRPGLPPYLAIRHLLDTAGSVDEAIAMLHALPLASSRNIMLCDRSRAAAVEILGEQVRVIEAREVVHANHFLHPDLAPGDELNRLARRSSVRRLERCRAGLAALPPGADAERHFALLSAPPVCVPANGDIRRERTVAAVVMLPGRGEFHLRAGNPSSSVTRTFTLN
jgi:isopenicillin-N N-acyltransferase like protein